MLKIQININLLIASLLSNKIQITLIVIIRVFFKTFFTLKKHNLSLTNSFLALK